MSATSCDNACDRHFPDECEAAHFDRTWEEAAEPNVCGPCQNEHLASFGLAPVECACWACAPANDFTAGATA